MPFAAGDSGRPRIGVMRMLFALVLAAFLGGALGLVWQSTSFFEDDEEQVLAVDEDTAEGAP